MNWKTIDQLTLEDLERSPVWEIRYEGEAEMVRETDLRETTDDPQRGFVVLTRFQFLDGTQACGYSSPQDPSGLDYIQPTIITDRGHWNLFTGANKPNKPDSTLFPLQCESTVRCDGVFWKETIEQDPTTGSSVL
ncbi:MAG: hypothetical protein ACYSW0_19325 [Planctomycetota bacterium]|jgi:hypothetical protein